VFYSLAKVKKSGINTKPIPLLLVF